MIKTEFSVSSLRDMNITMMWLDKDEFDLNPLYQREGEVWPIDKRQLLIDSLINEFDIPKIYLHELDKPKIINGRTVKYAIIDGKQRLETMWQFMENKWPLSKDFVYLRDESINLSGLLYKDLAIHHNRIYSKFNAQPLSVISIKTNDLDLIEEMFSRLNHSAALNAPEKRNALRGPIPIVIRELVEIPFFEDRFPITKKRYRHHDLACKFLYLEYKNGPVTTSKTFLDEFVKEFRDKSIEDAKKLESDVKINLSKMEKVFGSKDNLLKNVGTVVVLYLLFRKHAGSSEISKITRKTLEEFDESLTEARSIAEEDITKADPELLEFIHLSQSLNNVSAMEYKLEILERHIFKRK